MMWRLWWLVATACLAVRADEASDPDGLLESEATRRQGDDSEYYVEVGNWTKCRQPSIKEENTNSSLKRLDMADSLVHSPELGLQRRYVQCVKHDKIKGAIFADPENCGLEFNTMGEFRVCVLPQDCSLAEWLPWRPRSDGALVRTRRLKQLPNGGGKECDVVQEIRPTTLESTAHWVPGAWGSCHVTLDLVDSTGSVLENQDMDDDIYSEDDESEAEETRGTGGGGAAATCGGGLQRREATCRDAAGRTLHDAQCAHVPRPSSVQPCEVPCPRDCEVGEWTEWGACQPTDGCPLYPVQQLTTTGYSVRQRRVKTAASRGGAPCPPLEEKRACSAPRCAAWQPLPWGPCELHQPHTACGPGKRTRDLRCMGHDQKEAQRAWCSGTTAPARVERCRIACPGDCVVSAWGPWAPCSAPCAAPALPPPTRARQRHILAHASPKGWPCPSADQLIQQETCNTHACAAFSWLATPWGPCQRRTDDFMPSSNYTDFLDGDTFSESYEEEPCIEEGEMTREVMCVQNNADVVREALCAPLHRPESRRACTVRCRRGCRVEAWQPWTPCPESCEPNKQVRLRKVHGGPNCGAIEESRECPVSKSCTKKDAGWVTGEWSACRLPPRETCGSGYRIRSIWCGSKTHRVESGTCAGQAVPAAAAPCLVPCAGVAPPPPSLLTCQQVCDNPLKYLDASEHEIPKCICKKTVSVELLPGDSDCILQPGLECGEGRVLKAARCVVKGKDVPMDVCIKFHPLVGEFRSRSANTDGFDYDVQFPQLLSGSCTVHCARDCTFGEWNEWSPCVALGGSFSAYRMRDRQIIQEGSEGGRECGPTIQRMTCEYAGPPRWFTGPWSVCTPERALCGRAIINRTVICVDASGKQVDETQCEYAGARPTREAACRAPCPADCVVSSWSEWSPCEQTKWGGRRDRTRAVLRAAGAGGAACPALVDAEPCAPRRYSWHLADWDDCQPLGGSPCGEGTKKRSVRCLSSDGVFVNDSFCPNTTAMTELESWCYVPCGVDCELSAWSEWDTAACRCHLDLAANRHMRRTRQELTSAEWPGRPCGPKEQRAPCPRVPCMRLVSRPLMGCHVRKSNGEVAENACGWGVKVSETRCELVTTGPEPFPEGSLEPWRCAPALPGRVVAPAVAIEEEPCEIQCGCRYSELGVMGPWGEWSPCRGGGSTRSRKLLVPARKACRTPSDYITVEWSNCTEGEDSKTELEDVAEQDHHLYHDGYIEGSSSLLAVVWTATLILCFYGVFILYRGIISCLRSKKLKTITKV